MINKTVKGTGREGNVELLINRHKVSVKQSEYALEICCKHGS